MSDSDVPLLEIDQATVRRGGTTVFDGLSLTIGVSESLAVIGPNGAGKTTLARLLARELYPVYRDPPAVRIHGQARFAVRDYQASVGVVADHALRWLDPALSVRTVCSASSDPASEEYLAQFDLAALAGRTLSQLSSGERRRAMLARAMAHDPSVLVLDEPFSQLDPAATARLMRLVQAMAIGKTAVLLITHRLSDIPPEIGRVVGLRDGRVLFDGHKHTVLTAEALTALYGTPVRPVAADGWFALLPGN